MRITMPKSSLQSVAQKNCKTLKSITTTDVKDSSIYVCEGVDMRDGVLDFANRVNAKFGENVAIFGDKKQYLDNPRLSTGVLSMDIATGGGWPFARMCVVFGSESSGKSLLCLKASQQVALYDHNTKLPEYAMKDRSEFQPGCCLWVDAECAFDPKWASQVSDFDFNSNVIVRPDTGENVSDIVALAIAENNFDLIVVDSLDAMVPRKELEDSADQCQVGGKAKLLNQAFRRWAAALNTVSRTEIGPAVLCINQPRDSMLLFGNPETVPGGRGQKFYSSITVRMKPSKITDGCEKESAYGDYGGTCVKNKTHTPRRTFVFNACLAKGEEVPPGHIDNLDKLFKEALRCNLIDKSGKTIKFGKWETKTQKEMKALLAEDYAVQRSMWDSIVKEETDYEHKEGRRAEPIAITEEKEDASAG